MENSEKTKQPAAQRAVWIIQLVLGVLALAAFGLWVYKAESLSVLGVTGAGLSLGLFTLALMLAAPKAVRFLSAADEDPVRALGVRSGRSSGFSQGLRVVFAVLGARVLVVVLAYVFARVFRNYHGSIFATLESIWLKLDTDAPHYIGIAENWYSTEEPAMYALVFLPLFPLMIRGLNFIFGNSFVSAMVLNTVCSCAGAVVIHRLAFIEMGRRPAKLTVLFTFALPAAIFYIAPMSEALFLLLAASMLLTLRRNKFWLAAIFGALASFTRSVGIILIVPFIAEAAAYAVRRARSSGGKLPAGVAVKLAACAVILCLGSFAYLLINKLLWGDWFKFMEFQRDNWYQGFGPFFGTVSMQLDQLVSSFGSSPETALGLWLPNLLFIFGALAVLVFSARTMRTPYTLYFAAYFAVTCGATWLLSAPRYLTALICIPLALAHLCEGDVNGVATARAKAKASVVTVLFLVGQALYLIMYVMEYEIY
ncbi:MAG: hypothetical protein IKG85_10310 [Clostridia bacterium]|nr:hypothetical protein [Clostridia bacterium]